MTDETNAVEVEEVIRVPANPVLYKFTNKEDSPYLDSLLMMFYQGCFSNRIGIMESHNLATGNEEMILVGIEFDAEGKADCYPLARLLRAEDVPNFLSPDGKGGFYDQFDPVENAIAKENQRPVQEAVMEYSEPKEDSVSVE